jgi:hypothetical protein
VAGGTATLLPPRASLLPRSFTIDGVCAAAAWKRDHATYACVRATFFPHERLQREESASLAPRTQRTATSWRRARPFVLVVGGVGSCLLLPSLLSVFGVWRSLAHLDWPFAVLVLACEVASFVCLWELDRITLRMHPWLPMIAAQLTGNAMGRIFPGGGATATAVWASMLRQAGLVTGEAAARRRSSPA